MAEQTIKSWQAKTSLVNTIVDRRSWIVKQCEGKNILDIGFVADPNLIAEPNHAIPLHEQLLSVIHKYTGMDKEIPEKYYKSQEEECWETDKERYYIKQDIEDEFLDVNHSYGYEIIVLAEVLEHLSNPGKALENIKRMMGTATKLIISVPNGFNKKLDEQLDQGVEQVHHDHVNWYTPTTLVSLLTRHKFKINQLLGYAHNWDKCKQQQMFKAEWKTGDHYLKCPGLITACTI